MSAPQKKQVKVRVDQLSTYEIECTAAELVTKFTQMVAEYGPTATLNYDQHTPYDTSYSYAVYVERLETDEEFTRRVKTEEEQRATQDEQERRELGRLAAKFGMSK